MRTVLMVIGSGAAAAALVFGGATAASAAELPSGQTLYTVGPDGLYQVSSTGASTFVGGAGGLDTWGADYNPADGLGYFFDDGDVCSLYSVDLSTGAESLVGAIPDVFGDDGCDGFDIDADGSIWVAGEDLTIVNVSATDASVIATGTITGMSEIAFISTNPVDGVLYAGDYNGAIYSIDTTTWVATLEQDIDEYIESADFDSAGVLWFQGDGDTCNGLSSLVLGSSPVFQGDFLVGTDCMNTYSIFVAGEAVVVTPAAPQLAATGAGDRALIVLGLVGGGLLVAGGIVFAATARRRAGH